MYIAALQVIGFLMATPMFLIRTGSSSMRSERPFRDAVAGIGLTLGIWLDLSPVCCTMSLALRAKTRWTSLPSPEITRRVSEIAL